MRARRVSEVMVARGGIEPTTRGISVDETQEHRISRVRLIAPALPAHSRSSPPAALRNPRTPNPLSDTITVPVRVEEFSEDASITYAPV